MMTIPGGTNKGTPLSEATDRDLRYYAEKANSQELRDACAAILTERSATGGGAPPPRAERSPSRAMTSARQASVVEGSFGDSQSATAALRKAAEQYHLISPATVCGSLPEGCELALSLVHINPDDPNLYPLTGGKMGLDRVALAQIASAAGVSVVQSRRLDDGSHPHYCAWLCEITYRMFDGQLVRRQGTVEIDVREPDGAAYVEICEKAANGKTGPRSPDKQLLELRKFLTRHAETKAYNRAIAQMGVRRSYTKAELAKPFAVARVMFTGRSDDPDARKEFRAAIASSFMGATQQLYGPPPAQAARQIVEHIPQPPPPQGFDSDEYPEEY